jgi:hypothetical protein
MTLYYSLVSRFSAQQLFQSPASKENDVV